MRQQTLQKRREGCNKRKKGYRFKKAKDNIYQKNIIQVNNKVIYVDDFSNLHILDEDLNLIVKFSIYKKKIFKKYPLKFSIASSDNFVYLADNFGSVLAFDLVNLKLAWKIMLLIIIDSVSDCR